MNPPIGKGIKFLIKSSTIPKIGAFGEVRRAIHKRTNITRAVKIIYKEATDKEEHDKLINEVNILKNLVLYNMCHSNIIIY